MLAGEGGYTYSRSFSYVIGMGLERILLLYDGESESLSPFYDLLCTVVYNDAYKTKMAIFLQPLHLFFKEINLFCE